MGYSAHVLLKAINRLDYKTQDAFIKHLCEVALQGDYPGKALGEQAGLFNYMEIQVHGNLSWKRDIRELVIHPTDFRKCRSLGIKKKGRLYEWCKSNNIVLNFLEPTETGLTPQKP